MTLILIRHAHALPSDDDAARPLSERGRNEAARLARFFALNGRFTPAWIWHSPLLRARQTADELTRRLALDAAVIETPGLLPWDDPEELAARLARLPADYGDLAIVGHDPQLSRLAALLLRGKDIDDLLGFKKGAALALDRTGDAHKKTGLPRWRLRWFITPELLPATMAPATATPAPSPTVVTIPPAVAPRTP